MKIESTYPLFTVKALSESRSFFIKYFELPIIFEANWIVVFGHESTGPILGLMSSDHPSTPPGPETFTGLGAIFTIQLSDVAVAYKKCKAENAPITYALADEPWGQRRFMMKDPSGIQIDIVQQTEPKAGFWEKYS